MDVLTELFEVVELIGVDIWEEVAVEVSESSGSKPVVHNERDKPVMFWGIHSFGCLVASVLCFYHFYPQFSHLYTTFN